MKIRILCCLAALCLIVVPFSMAESSDKGFWPISVNWHGLTRQEWVESEENRAIFSFLITNDAAHSQENLDIVFKLIEAINRNTIYFWKGSSGSLAVMFASDDDLYTIGIDPSAKSGIFENGQITILREKLSEEDMLIALEEQRKHCRF